MESSAHSESASVASRERVRGIWFPLAILALAAAWWMRRAAYAEYATFTHVIVVLVCAILITGWFITYGGGRPRTRRWVAALSWLAFAAWMIAMKPVYNGDMGIYSCALRHAANPDQRLTGIKPHELAADAGAADWQPTPRDYPRFLGTGHWPEVSGVKLETDWTAHPPQEIWRHEIGAGWSGFAIVGNYAFTQEQRGDQELVSCYRVDSGESVWAQSDASRFDPADFAGGLGGIGPRATPTIHAEKVLTQGATGIVNCLDARTGKVVWSHDTVEETGAEVLTWGKSGSPLVVDDMVVISIGAPSEPALLESFSSSLVAYDLESGQLRWASGNRRASYASPVLATIAGERQIIMLNESYVTSHRASDGKILWEFPWANESDTSASCTQPIPLEGDRVFLSKGYGVGAAMLQIARDEGGSFTTRPLWSPPIRNVMKTKFATVVVRGGFIYGLDDVLLECIEMETGAVAWKRRRSPEFGHGQIMLIGDAILVLSETGELALVEASPEAYRELSSIQALDPADITWNTPAFSAPYLLIRNAREVACYRLPVVDPK